MQNNCCVGIMVPGSMTSERKWTALVSLLPSTLSRTWMWWLKLWNTQAWRITGLLHILSRHSERQAHLVYWLRHRGYPVQSVTSVEKSPVEAHSHWADVHGKGSLLCGPLWSNIRSHYSKHSPAYPDAMTGDKGPAFQSVGAWSLGRVWVCTPRVQVWSLLSSITVLEGSVEHTGHGVYWEVIT